MKMYITETTIDVLLEHPTAWSKSKEIAQLRADSTADLGYPALEYRADGSLYIAFYQDPSLDHTPEVYTAVLSKTHDLSLVSETVDELTSTLSVNGSKFLTSDVALSAVTFETVVTSPPLSAGRYIFSSQATVGNLTPPGPNTLQSFIYVDGSYNGTQPAAQTTLNVNERQQVTIPNAIIELTTSATVRLVIRTGEATCYSDTANTSEGATYLTWQKVL